MIPTECNRFEVFCNDLQFLGEGLMMRDYGSLQSSRASLEELTPVLQVMHTRRK